MATISIEERAKEAIDEWVESGGLLKVFVSKALLDQDRIARQEEREICTHEAAEALCEICRECDSFDFDDYCPKQKIIIDALRHDNTSIPGQ